MNRLLALLLASGATALGCSLINAPDDVKAAPIGAGGGTSSTVSSSNSSTDVASSSTGPIADCAKDADCAANATSCMDAKCEAGKCKTTNKADNLDCDDGNFCTVGEKCSSGNCTSSTPMVCPDPIGNPCNVGFCDQQNKKCTTAPAGDGKICDGIDSCSPAGTCKSGTCDKGVSVCVVAGNECNTATCNPTSHKCDPVPANEGQACGLDTQCGITSGNCANGVCSGAFAPDGSFCDDGIFCTGTDGCVGGKCRPGVDPCGPSSTCTKATCDEAGKVCSYDNQSEGSACGNNSCETNGTCSMGTCIMASSPNILFSDDFHDNSKGWTLGPEWLIGPAAPTLGDPGSTVLGADPSFDHTGSQDNGVAAVAPGFYTQAYDPSTKDWPHYLTSPVIDITNGSPVSLQFYRWLNSDAPSSMTNVVEVTSDGVKWTKIWDSKDYVVDTPPFGQGWTFQTLDVSVHKSTTFQVRFGYSIISAVVEVGGWNIDDVVLATASCK